MQWPQWPQWLLVSQNSFREEAVEIGATKDPRSGSQTLGQRPPVFWQGDAEYPFCSVFLKGTLLALTQSTKSNSLEAIESNQKRNAYNSLLKLLALTPSVDTWMPMSFRSGSMTPVFDKNQRLQWDLKQTSGVRDIPAWFKLMASRILWCRKVHDPLSSLKAEPSAWRPVAASPGSLDCITVNLYQNAQTAVKWCEVMWSDVKWCEVMWSVVQRCATRLEHGNALQQVLCFFCLLPPSPNALSKLRRVAGSSSKGPIWAKYESNPELIINSNDSNML